MIALADRAVDLYGEGTSKGVEWITKASDAGSARAMYELGLSYYRSSQYKKAEEWLKKAIDGGYHCWSLLGSSYSGQQKYNEAVDAFKKGIEAGEYECAATLSGMYYAGYVINQNYKASMKYGGIYVNNLPKKLTEQQERTRGRIVDYAKAVLKSKKLTKAEIIGYFGEEFYNQYIK